MTRPGTVGGTTSRQISGLFFYIIFAPPATSLVFPVHISLHADAKLSTIKVVNDSVDAITLPFLLSNFEILLKRCKIVLLLEIIVLT